MRRLAFAAAAFSLSLVAPAARAHDDPMSDRQRALEARERHQDEREQSLNERARSALRDDQRDLARIESLAERLETMRTARPPKWAVVALDADVQREIFAEQLEGGEELKQGTEAGRSRYRAQDWHRGPGGGRRGGERMGDGERERGGDVNAQQVEAAQGQRLEYLRQEWANLDGQYGRPGLERRRVLMGELVALARQELAGDRRDLRSAR